jgi:hypothetical protein
MRSDACSGRRWALLLLAVPTVALATGGVDPHEAADPAELLARFDAVPYPMGIESDVPEELEAFEEGIASCTRMANALALEFYERYPTHPEAARLLGSRWRLAVNNLGESRTVREEAERVLAGDPTPAIQRKALVGRAYAGIRDHGLPLVVVRQLVEQALDGAVGEKEARLAELLWELAAQRIRDPRLQGEVLAELVERYRSTGQAHDAALHLRLLRRVGRSFELAFQDSVTRQSVDVARLQGRPVLVVLLRMGPRMPSSRAALRELAGWQADAPGIPILCLWANGSPDRIAEADRFAREVGLDWNLCFDEPGSDDGWDERLRPAVAPLYLWLDEDGRLEAASMRLATVVRD